MEVKYLFTPARSSTSHSSHVVYPCSGTSSSSTIPLPLSAEVLAVLPEASVGCLAATFRRHFLKPAPAQELGCFLAVDTPTSPAAGTLAVDGAADPLSAPLSDFILSSSVSSGDNIGTELLTVREVHSVRKLQPQQQEMKKKCNFQPLLLEGAPLTRNPLRAAK
ncbi:hypothetical protein BHM03_00015036 [Ensete ventricosum]|nr:hypothetical protein BHM03_00015036 [Ensete ventricosum]